VVAEPRNATVEIDWIEPSALAYRDRVEEVRLFEPEPTEQPRRVPSDRALAVERWWGRWREWYGRWGQLSWGAPSPRVDSVVRRVLRCDVATAVTLIGAQAGAADGLELLGPLGAAGPSPMRQAPARLRLRWSYPSVPVWLVVEPWWRDQALVSIRLRTTRRWRYPVRYFATAHRVLDRLAPASGSSAAGVRRHQPARKAAAAW